MKRLTRTGKKLRRRLVPDRFVRLFALSQPPLKQAFSVIPTHPFKIYQYVFQGG